MTNKTRLHEAILPYAKATSLHAEHRRLMDDRHKSVPWDRSTAGNLPEKLRLSLGELWHERAIAEHRSTGVLLVFAQDLLGVGVPVEVLSVACRAALDEVRHAELFARVAQLYLGHAIELPPGIAQLPEDPRLSLQQQIAQEALYLLVFSETYSLALLSTEYDRAVDPVIHAVYASVLSDEVYHARLGWALLDGLFTSAQGSELRELVQRQLTNMFDYFVDLLFGNPSELPSSELTQQEEQIALGHGYASRREEWRIFQDTLTDLWIPGLSALGITANHLLNRYPSTPSD